jgi:hypothetical protein
VQPGIDILGLELKTFGLMFALAFVVSGLIVGRGLREAGKPQDWAYEMVFAALAGGLIGARGYWLIENAGDLDGGVLKRGGDEPPVGSLERHAGRRQAPRDVDGERHERLRMGGAEGGRRLARQGEIVPGGRPDEGDEAVLVEGAAPRVEGPVRDRLDPLPAQAERQQEGVRHDPLGGLAGHRPGEAPLEPVEGEHVVVILEIAEGAEDVDDRDHGGREEDGHRGGVMTELR